MPSLLFESTIIVFKHRLLHGVFDWRTLPECAISFDSQDFQSYSKVNFHLPQIQEVGFPPSRSQST